MKQTTNTRSNGAILNEIMNYEHQGVISRMMKEFDLSNSEAKELFNDTKRFLFLAAVAEKEISPTKPIDDGWHTFLLFTKDYYDFCLQSFGYLIHHNPFDDQELKEKGVNGISSALQLAQYHFGSVLSKNWSHPASGCGGCGCGGGSCGGDRPPICCPDLAYSKK